MKAKLYSYYISGIYNTIINEENIYQRKRQFKQFTIYILLFK